LEAGAAGARRGERVFRRRHQSRGSRGALEYRRVLRAEYFCDPRGQIIAQASRDRDEVLTADLDLDQIAEVRKTWQFFRDRRPDMYESLVKA